jgi:hypothetical protein
MWLFLFVPGDCKFVTGARLMRLHTSMFGDPGEHIWLDPLPNFAIALVLRAD